MSDNGHTIENEDGSRTVCGIMFASATVEALVATNAWDAVMASTIAAHEHTLRMSELDAAVAAVTERTSEALASVRAIMVEVGEEFRTELSITVTNGGTDVSYLGAPRKPGVRKSSGGGRRGKAVIVNGHRYASSRVACEQLDITVVSKIAKRPDGTTYEWLPYLGTLRAQYGQENVTFDGPAPATA